jgi:hypothetical protein
MASADALVVQGYTAHTIRGVLRATCAFGEWLAARGHAVDDVDNRFVARFAGAREALKSGRANILLITACTVRFGAHVSSELTEDLRTKPPKRLLLQTQEFRLAPG